MSISQWELELGLDTLGLSDADKQTVEKAIPIASAMVGHISDNQQLFATLFADSQLVLPAVKILLAALKTNKMSITIKRSTSDGQS